MIANVENTIAWLRVNGLKYFRVSLTESDNTKVFESADNETFEHEIERFRQVMELSQGGRYFIVAADTKEAKRGKYSETFRNVNDVSSSVISSNTPAVSGFTRDDIEQAKEQAKAELKAEMERERINTELKELRQELNSRNGKMDMLIERIVESPHVGQLLGFIMSKFLPATTPVAVAGITRQQPAPTATPVYEQQQNFTSEDMNEEIETNEQEADRIEAALQKLAKAEPNYIVLLEKIAEMASSGDPMFGMAKSFLMK